jgi:mRNA-degrading endonuclease RelE of RelBE toxin-antitoxin system
MWQIVKKTQFNRQYNNIGKTRQKLTDQAILNLANSENPAELGVFKPHLGTFAYELGRGDRLIYDIDYPTKTIILLRVCDREPLPNKSGSLFLLQRPSF